MTSKGQSGDVTGRVFYRNHRLYPPSPGSRGQGLGVTMVSTNGQHHTWWKLPLLWSEQLRRHLERDGADNMLLVNTSLRSSVSGHQQVRGMVNVKWYLQQWYSQYAKLTLPCPMRCQIYSLSVGLWICDDWSGKILSSHYPPAAWSRLVMQL